MAELRRTLAWARAASPFLAERLAGIELDALRTPQDLAALPRMEPANLAAPRLLTVSQDDVARVVSLKTSGSSGPPKRLCFSDADLIRTLEFFNKGMSTFCGRDDVVLVLLPGRRQWGVADLLALALPGIGARAVLPREDWSAASLPGLMHAEAVTCIIAAPVQLSRLLTLQPEHFNEIRAVLSSAEPLSNHLRQAVQQAWSCEVFDHWGMTETGYGGGVECRAHNGYHLREADLLLEVAHPLTGAPLAEGERGEILVTTLGPRAMPLLRYKTGDAARWIPGPCPCGSALRRLGPVAGRLSTDGVNIVQTNKGWVERA